MIAITRRALWRFRAACARCIVGRIRGPAPPVVIRQTKGRVTLTAAFPEVTLELGYWSAATQSEVLIVPMTVLDEVGATTVDLVELESTGMLKGTARWEENGKSKTHPLDLILPGKQHDTLPRPQELQAVPANFLVALHEAGRTSSREDGRYSLSKVQVRGGKGQVIATTASRCHLRQVSLRVHGRRSGAAIPLFGCPEVCDEQKLHVGCHARHLVVNAGDWTVWLLVAPSGKFPDVAAVVPRQAPTTVDLDRLDAAKLLPQLPQLPGQKDENRPVTLKADGVLTVSGHDESAKDAKEIPLASSVVTGPPAKVVLDRRALARILALGCTTLRFTPNKALVGVSAEVTVLVAPLDPQLATPINDIETRHLQSGSNNPYPHPTPERNTAMKPHDTNGSAHNGRHDPPQVEVPDPLVAAEELRDALGEVLAKATRLIAALKATRKEKKVLASVWAGLRQLNLNPKNGGKHE